MNTITHAKTRHNLITYLVTGIILGAVALLLPAITWQGNVHLHTFLETVATLLATMVGILALIRFYAQKDVIFLLIGSGFLGTALLDGYHVLVSSSFFSAAFPSPPPSLSPWSWSASRVLLSLLLFLSWWIWYRRNKTNHSLGQLSEPAIYWLISVLTLTSFALFAFVPLPPAYYPQLILHRPGELVAAFFLAVALLGYLTKGAWKTDEFEHWLVLSMILGLAVQLIFMPFSDRLYDIQFDVSHLLKIASYISVLTGLLVSLKHLYSASAQQKAALEAEITERKRIETSLRQTEQRYRSLFEKAPVMYVVTHNHNGIPIITDCNRLFSDTLDYHRTDLLNQPLANFYTPKSRAALLEQGGYQQALTGLLADQERQLLTQSGQIVDTILHAQPHTTISGQTQGTLAMFVDVTQRKQTEKRLTESEERLRTVVTNAPIVLFATDRRGKLTFLEGTDSHALMLSKASIGQSLFEIYQETVPQVISDIHRALAGETVGTITNIEGLSFETWYSPLKNEAGKITGAIGVATNITEQVRAETELNLFFTLSLDMLCIAGTDGYFKRLNPAFEKTLGYSQQELLSRPYLNLVHPDDQPATRAELQKLPQGKVIVDFETRFQCKDGSYRWLTWNATPATDAGLIYAVARDTTERKQAEEELKFRNTILKTQQEALPNGILVVNKNGQWISFNQRFLEMWDIEPEIAAHKNSHLALQSVRDKLVDPETFVAKIQYLYTHYHEKSYDEIYLNDGRIFDRYSAPMIGADQQYYGRVWYYRDITERKRIEEKLTESEKNFREIVMRSPIATVTTFIDGQGELVNEKFTQLFGYTAKDVPGLKKWWELAYPNPEYRERVHAAWQAAIEKSQATGTEIDPQEWQVTCKDGTVREIEFRSIPLGNKQVTTFFDLTERKRAEAALRESEERFRSIFENAPIGISIGQGGRIIQSNWAFQQMLGYPAAELKTLNFIQLTHPEDRASSQEALKELIAGQRNFFQTEKRYLRNDGQLIWGRISVAAIPDEQGQPLRTVGMLENITERKQAEEKRLQLLKELESANQELKDFAYVVSHDLKAPLRAIGSLTSWLSTDYTEQIDEEGQELITLLQGRVRRMESLIEGVLQYSRVGRVREALVQVNLNSLIPEIKEMLAPPPHIIITVKNKLPVVWAEPTRIEQLFQNLLSNAIKFMDKPQGQIDISCVDNTNCWQFSIADNGPGIDPKYFEKIFQIFQTLTARDEFESSGVGLSVVKKIVEMYGGEIWIESEINQGTTFFFTLPKEPIVPNNHPVEEIL